MVAVDVTWRSRADVAWPWLALVVRLVLGGVWLAAGAAKIGDPEASVRAVRAYQLVPDSLERAVGYSLPLLEICLVGIASAWARGLQIDCGCFGGGGASGGDPTAGYRWDILRDVGLLILAGMLAWRPTSRFSVDGLLYPDRRTREVP